LLLLARASLTRDFLTLRSVIICFAAGESSEDEAGDGTWVEVRYRGMFRERFLIGVREGEEGDGESGWGLKACITAGPTVCFSYVGSKEQS